MSLRPLIFFSIRILLNLAVDSIEERKMLRKALNYLLLEHVEKGDMEVIKAADLFLHEFTVESAQHQIQHLSWG